MKKWAWGVFLVLITFGVIGIFLYQYTGLKEYRRIETVINKLPDDQKAQALLQVEGTNFRGAESGVLAGNWLGRVWVWGMYGLRSYKVDQYSVYTLFDGCDPEIKKLVDSGHPNAIRREVIFSFAEWVKKATDREYVVVYPTVKDQGGTVGNLREIYYYNFWEFMPLGMDTKCAKS